MIYVRRRSDLREQNILIPTKFSGHQTLNNWRLAFQPDELDDQEYAVIVLDKDGEVCDIFNSIDLDYLSIEEYNKSVKTSDGRRVRIEVRQG